MLVQDHLCRHDLILRGICPTCSPKPMWHKGCPECTRSVAMLNE